MTETFLEKNSTAPHDTARSVLECERYAPLWIGKAPHSGTLQKSDPKGMPRKAKGCAGAAGLTWVWCNHSKSAF
jgi:hypothetical protein